MGEILADTGYSSGSALQYLEAEGINAWIPNFGQFTPEREGFVYNKELNQYACYLLAFFIICLNTNPMADFMNDPKSMKKVTSP